MKLAAGALSYFAAIAILLGGTIVMFLALAMSDGPASGVLVRNGDAQTEASTDGRASGELEKGAFNGDGTAPDPQSTADPTTNERRPVWIVATPTYEYSPRGIAEQARAAANASHPASPRNAGRQGLDAIDNATRQRQVQRPQRNQALGYSRPAHRMHRDANPFHRD